jgi:1,4-dihydroxy-2-naphthoate octaprenyltransferase
VAVGALATNILLVNNYRDAETDAKAGKQTLVVRFGKPFAQWQFGAALLLACGVFVALAWRGLYPRGIGAAGAGALGLFGIFQWRRLRAAGSAADVIPLLGQCAAYLAVYALSLAAALVMGK